jgi:SAM-dependent methyltransferase
MGRIHAFEFEDQAWFPSAIRQYMTDFLSFMGGWSKIPYQPFTERLAEVLRRTGDQRVVDLCSGGGGPAVLIAGELRERLGRPVDVVLTDLYPSPQRLEHARAVLPDWVKLEARAVDAQDVPADLEGFRLVCNGFHHLKPEQARSCLLDAVKKRSGVAIVELAQRSPLSMLQIAVGTVTQLVVTPFIKPFCWSRLLFTYALPVVPLCTLWDGIVSCLRVYDPDELRGLVAQLPKNDYQWECGRLSIPRVPAQLTYLIGSPASRAQ